MERNLEYLLSKYDLWSRYVPEDNAVAIFYASMYGDTENAANILAAGLAEGGIKISRSTMFPSPTSLS